jgi:uncharacterized protein (DUF488 family)
VADVRSYPSSRRWPQFNQNALEASLTIENIAYLWLKPLGGRRHTKREHSPNAAWEQDSFRSYADYADGVEFAGGLADLLAAAVRARTAIMCAEGLWWQCHRRIISDHLLARGPKVVHILPNGQATAHKLTEFAKQAQGRLTYPARQHDLLPADGQK